MWMALNFKLDYRIAENVLGKKCIAPVPYIIAN